MDNPSNLVSYAAVDAPEMSPGFVIVNVDDRLT
jgi:hypothetical protein